MSQRKVPPFRAEHLGSLLRPASLIKARQAWRDGKLPRDELTRMEDDAIREVVALQERVGLQVISDGEFRKRSWRDLLFEATEGYSRDLTPSDFTFTDYSGQTRKGGSVPDAIGRLRRREPMAPGFEFVRKLTARTVKATLPAPSVNHFFRGDRMLEKGPYRGDRRAYFGDIAAIYRQEIADLAAQGCTYLQIDDVPSAVVCDPRNAQVVGDRGEDPEALVDQYYELFNDAVRERPANMTIGVHLCRCNSGHGQASGGYERIAQRLFQKLDANVYFLEYDTERAGGFEPLRHLPRDRFAVLGIISTKLSSLEPVDELRRRVDQATRFVDLERLCLSPQCGFASSYEQTRFSEADEVRKLEHLVRASQKLWGDA